jgi:hypothetical protein
MLQYIIIKSSISSATKMSAIRAWAIASRQQQQQQFGLILGSQQHTAVIVQPPVHQRAVIVLQQAPQLVVPLYASAIASNEFTYTYLQPSLRSQTAWCIVSAGFMLTITGMTQDGQWYSLDTNTWIPRSWIHGLHVYH